MAEFGDKLNAILSNPELMGQIMSMANSMGSSTPPMPVVGNGNESPFDPGSMQKILELLRGTQIDQRQQNLLKALGAYLPSDRVNRLQKAMQASKIARFAATAMSKNKGG